MGEGEEEVNDVDALEPATGRGDLGEHLDGGHLRVEGDIILEGAEPCLVDEGEEIGARAALDCALAGLVPRSADQFSSLEIRCAGKVPGNHTVTELILSKICLAEDLHAK